VDATSTIVDPPEISPVADDVAEFPRRPGQACPVAALGVAAGARLNVGADQVDACGGDHRRGSWGRRGLGDAALPALLAGQLRPNRWRADREVGVSVQVRIPDLDRRTAPATRGPRAVADVYARDGT